MFTEGDTTQTCLEHEACKEEERKWQVGSRTEASNAHLKYEQWRTGGVFLWAGTACYMSQDTTK